MRGYKNFDSDPHPGDLRHMIVVMASFRGRRGVNAVLFRRILVWRGCPPYASVNRNTDVRQSLLYLFHPLTPLAREAFRPR